MTLFHRSSVFLFSLLLSALMAVPALAQAPYPGGTGVQCDTTLVTPGGTLTCSIDACVPGTPITGTAEFETTSDGDRVTSRGTETQTQTSTADANGTGSVTFDVPDDATGSVDVTLSCLAPDGSVQVLGVDDVAQVAAAGDGNVGDDGDDGDQGGGVLGVTGGPFQTLSIAVAALLAAGAALLVIGGRRRGQVA